MEQDKKPSPGGIPASHGLALLILACCSPALRAVSRLGAGISGRAGWISILLVCFLYLGLYFILRLLSRYGEGRGWGGVSGAFRFALGPLSKPILLVYAVWVFVLVGLSLRAFAERYAALIMPGTPIPFFLIAMLILCYIFVSGRFAHFTRFAAIELVFICLCFLCILLLKLNKIEAGNLWPVTTLDAVPALAGVYPLAGALCCITFLTLGGDFNMNKPRSGRQGLISAGILAAILLIIFLTTVGVFGAKLTQSVSEPFFMSVKTVSIFDSLKRLESVFIVSWVVTDVAMIVMLLRILFRLADGVTCRSLDIRTPVLMGAYVLSLFIAGSAEEVQEFSTRLALPVNVLLGIAVPVVVLGLAAIRQGLRKRRKKKAPG
jgi:hypothetical protein